MSLYNRLADLKCIHRDDESLHLVQRQERDSTCDTSVLEELLTDVGRLDDDVEQLITGNQLLLKTFQRSRLTKM